MKSRDYRAISMRTIATKDLAKSIISGINTTQSFEILTNYPVVTPYQRIMIVESDSLTVISDTNWKSNYIIQSFKYESPIHKLLQDKFGGYPAPALKKVEIVNRLKKYIASKTTKLNIIDYRFLYFLDHIRIHQNDYSLILLTDKSDILESSRIYKIYLFLLTILSVLIGFIITYSYYIIIIKPLKKLTNSIKQLEDGKVLSSIYIDREDEIGTLSKAFYNKTKQLLEKSNSFEDFTNDVLHEIKNPLTSIRNSIELLLSRHTGIYNKEILYHLIQTESGRVEKLLYDIKEYSQIDLETKINDKCNPGNVILKVLQLYTKFGIKSDINCNIEIPLSELQLVSVITNLLDNAISFSPMTGSVVIKCDNRGFSVSDMGPGIPDIDKKKVFNRFFSNRSHNSDLHSGLGLSIVKAILEKNNHSIDFKSNMKGTIFFVSFNVIKM